MDNGALEQAWSELEALFVAMSRSVQSMAGGTRRLAYEKEEAAARAALAALSYDPLLTLLSDPRWYEPLPEFEKIPSGFESGCMRFMTCITILPRTEEAVRAVKARPHHPPPLPPKPSWMLLLRLRIGEFYGRRYFRECVQQEYAAYSSKCQQFIEGALSGKF